MIQRYNAEVTSVNPVTAQGKAICIQVFCPRSHLRHSALARCMWSIHVQSREVRLHILRNGRLLREWCAFLLSRYGRIDRRRSGCRCRCRCRCRWGVSPCPPGIPGDHHQANEDDEDPYAEDDAKHDELAPERIQIPVQERPKDAAIVAPNGGVRDGLGDLAEQRRAEEEDVVGDGGEGDVQVGLEKGDGGREGVDLAAEHAVEELARGGREERAGAGAGAVAKRGGDARLDLGVVLDDGRVERARGGVDPAEELRVEGGADAAERGVHRARVGLRVARERAVDRRAERTCDAGGERVGLLRDAGLDGAHGDELDADDEDAEEADDEAGERGRVEDEREVPREAVAGDRGEGGDAGDAVEDAPGEGVLHLGVEGHERGLGDLEARAGPFLGSGGGGARPARPDDLGRLREPPPLHPDEDAVPEDDEDGARDEDADADVRDAREVVCEGVEEGHVHAAAELDGVDGGDGEGDIADLAGDLGKRRVHLGANRVEWDADELVQTAAELVQSGEGAVQCNNLLLEGVRNIKISYLAHVEAESRWIDRADWIWSWSAAH